MNVKYPLLSILLATSRLGTAEQASDISTHHSEDNEKHELKTLGKYTVEEIFKNKPGYTSCIYIVENYEDRQCRHFLTNYDFDFLVDSMNHSPLFISVLSTSNPLEDYYNFEEFFFNFPTEFTLMDLGFESDAKYIDTDTSFIDLAKDNQTDTLMLNSCDHISSLDFFFDEETEFGVLKQLFNHISDEYYKVDCFFGDIPEQFLPMHEEHEYLFKYKILEQRERCFGHLKQTEDIVAIDFIILLSKNNSKSVQGSIRINSNIPIDLDRPYFSSR